MVSKADKSSNIKNKPDPLSTFNIISLISQVLFQYYDELYKLIAIPRAYYAETYENVVEVQ